MSNLESRLRGYRLTTAENDYRLPDHPAMLQTFIWQDLDVAPRFPVLTNSSASGRPRSRASCSRCASRRAA